MVVGTRIFTGVLLAALLGSGLFLVPFPSGWEGKIALVGLKIAEAPNVIYALNCKGYSTETEEILVNWLSECSTGGSTWTIDVDAKNSGRPSILATTQQVRHTDGGGIPTNTDAPAATSTITRQRDTFYIDRHIFMFEFQVHTSADVEQIACVIETCFYNHETSLGGDNPQGGLCVIHIWGSDCRGFGGRPFDGSSLILFSIDPWQGIRVPPPDEPWTIRFDQWVGIMGATIFQTTPTVRQAGQSCLNCPEGKVPNAPGSQDSPWAVEKMIAEGANPNMFYLNGTDGKQFQIGSVEGLVAEFGTVPLDRRIPQQVLIELPYKLTVGSAVSKNFLGGITEIKPINVFAKYIVRVDVAIVTGWTPQLDYIDSNANGVLDPGEFAFIDKNQDNKWTLGVDTAVQGTPPSPPPPPPPGVTVVSNTTDVRTESDGTKVTTITVKYSDGSTWIRIFRETPSLPPSPPQVGCPPLCPPTIQPPPDIFFPSCNFFDLECRLNNWRLFPFDLGGIFNLALPIIVIAAAIFVGLLFIGVARGRRGR